jgi:hypothetical protein
MPGAESQFRISESRRALTDSAVHIDTANVTWARRTLQRLFGSYGALALFFPGGNLISLALWMLQHRTWLAARARRGLSAAWTGAVRRVFPR